MKTGQGTGPCGSRSSPARARLRPHSAVIRSSGAGPGPIALGAAIFPLSHVTHASGRPCVPPEVAVTGGNAAAMLGLRPLRWASVGARRGAGGESLLRPPCPPGRAPSFPPPRDPRESPLSSPPRRAPASALLSLGRAPSPGPYVPEGEAPLLPPSSRGEPPPLVPKPPRGSPLLRPLVLGQSPLPWSLSPSRGSPLLHFPASVSPHTTALSVPLGSSVPAAPRISAWGASSLGPSKPRAGLSMGRPPLPLPLSTPFSPWGRSWAVLRPGGVQAPHVRSVEGPARVGAAARASHGKPKLGKYSLF